MSEEPPSDRALSSLPAYRWKKRSNSASPPTGSVNSAQKKFGLVVNAFKIAKIAAVLVLALLIVVRL